MMGVSAMNTRQSGRFSWKLVGGLALFAVGIGALIATQGTGAPLSTYLPFLLILACPLMMIFMLGSMDHGSDAHEVHKNVRGVSLDEMGQSHDEQIWALRNELTRMAWRQESLRQELERLETDKKAVIE